jgi:arginyl-tRNA synthetase
MEEKIRKAVNDYLTAQGAREVVFVVERPLDISHGDYTTNVALVAAKPLGKNPRELADAIAAHLMDTLGEHSVSHVSVAGHGFVNVKLSREAVTLATSEAGAQGEGWGVIEEDSSSPRVMVEYTDPNPFKEMHIGHLMSNIIGESIARLTANEGAHVIRACYQGDVGPHVAKALWGLEKAGVSEPTTAKELGEAYALGSSAYETSPEAKAEIDALNIAIYEKSSVETMELWRKGRDMSLAEFERLYTILGTKFDYYFFESETSEPGVRIVKNGLEKGVFETGEGGAIIYNGEKKGSHTLVFITSRGTPTYEAKEMGLAFLKEERAQFDRSIIVTASEQIGHFKVFLSALGEVAPKLAEKTTHVPHGFLRLMTGKMSSREGNVITADELIKEVIEKASEKNEDPLIAEQVALGAIKYMILRQSPGSDIIFDKEKSLSLEGDSGPYLQYALVRAKKILTYAGESGGTEEPVAPYQIERSILHYPEVVARAARELAPNLLVTYLTELASEWNAFYASEQVLGSSDELYKQRVARAFAQTMTNGLTLLGIPTPEKM